MKIKRFNDFSASLVLLSGILFFSVLSCRHDDDLSQYPVVCFESDILPIFQTGCAISGCHDGLNESYDLSSYNGIKMGVTPGDPMKSSAYTVLSKIWSPESFMPPDRPLSLENRSRIKVWIEQGALETTCP